MRANPANVSAMWFPMYASWAFIHKMETFGYNKLRRMCHSEMCVVGCVLALEPSTTYEESEKIVAEGSA